HRTTGFADAGAAPIEAMQAAGMPVTYRDVEKAKAILIVGLDAENELPILHLRIRKTAIRGAKVFVVHPRRTRLWDVGEWYPSLPGEEADLPRMIEEAEAGSELWDLRSALVEAGSNAVVLAGPRLVESPGAGAAMSELAGRTGAKVAVLC